MFIQFAILFLVVTMCHVPICAQDTMTVAFGSCNRTDLDQSHWTVIDHQNVDAWIWLGDIVYADSDNPKVIKKKYKELLKHPLYHQFHQGHNIYGVWDDHDYGENDRGNDFDIKDKSRDILYKFLKLPKPHPSWQHAGAYQSHILNKGAYQIKLLLLDVRYFRDKLALNPDEKIRYIPDDAASMLGENQWTWLEKELASSKEDLIIIGSGTQIIPEEHGYEKWADYPAERTRFFQLLEKYSEKRIVLLSGDRHMAEVSAFAVDEKLYLYEITSSGLTHTWTTKEHENNGYRIRNMYPEKNFGLLHLYENDNKIHVTAELKSIHGTTLDHYEIYPQ